MKAIWKLAGAANAFFMVVGLAFCLAGVKWDPWCLLCNTAVTAVWLFWDAAKQR